MTLYSDALAIVRRQLNARNNAGQQRIMNINNTINVLKARHGNQAVNQALANARRRVNARVQNAVRRFTKGPHKARTAAMHAELNALRFVPVNTFRVKRGRSPSPVRAASTVKKARAYA